MVDDWFETVKHDLNRVYSNLEGLLEYPDEVSPREAADTMHKAVDDLREIIRSING